MKKVNPDASNFKVEGATLIFRNFSGEATNYNRKGDQNFSVLLSEDDAQMLLKDGWNVKRLKPREDDPEHYEQPYLQVKVNYEGKYPPIVVLITSSGKLRLTEDTVNQLDWTRIANADLIITPYYYNSPTYGEGLSAYLKTLYVTVQEDELDKKYADIPYINNSEPVIPFDLA